MKTVRSERFESINPTVHQQMNQIVSMALGHMWSHNPEARAIIFDGGDAGTTTTMRNYLGDSFTIYRANLSYFQKDKDTFFNQLRVLISMWNEAVNQIKPSDFLDEKSTQALLPVGKLGFFFLDTISYPIVSKRILEKAFILKRQRNDTSEFVVALTDIVRTEDRKMAMFKKLSLKNLKFRKLYNLLQKYKSISELDILLEGKTMAHKIAERYGYRMVDLDESEQFSDERFSDEQFGERFTNNDSENRNILLEPKFNSLIYTGNNVATAMRFSIMRFRRVDVDEVNMGDENDENDENDDEDDDISMTDALDIPEDDVMDDPAEISKLMSDTFYCDPNIVKIIYEKFLRKTEEAHANIKSFITLVKRKSPVEVIDILINLSLHEFHNDKIVENLIVYSKPRTFKSANREIIQIICDMPEFIKYNDNRKVVPHLMVGPYVTIPTRDNHDKSKGMQQKIGSKYVQLLPTQQDINKGNITRAQPYVAGMTINNLEKLIEIIHIDAQKRTSPILVLDEADRYLSMGLYRGEMCKFERLLRDTLFQSESISGICYQSATVNSILLRNMTNRCIFGHVEVFQMQPPDDYHESYENLYPLDRKDKLTIDGDNNMHSIIQKFLDIDLYDEMFFNRAKKQRAYPTMLVMPTTLVNAANGFLNMAKELSAGRFANIKSRENPVCICVSGNKDKFQVFADGSNITDEINAKIPPDAKTGKRKRGSVNNLQSFTPHVANFFKYSRHIIIFGYNVMGRGITVAWNNEMDNVEFEDDSNPDCTTLGYISHMIAYTHCTEGLVVKRAINELDQFLSRFKFRCFEFDIPCFENHKCCVAVLPDILENLELLREDEAKLVELVDEHKDLDKAWELHQPKVVFERLPHMDLRKTLMKTQYELEDKDFEYIHSQKRHSGKTLYWTIRQALQYALKTLYRDRNIAVPNFSIAPPKVNKKTGKMSLENNGLRECPHIQYVAEWLYQNRTIWKSAPNVDLEEKYAIRNQMEDDYPYLITYCTKESDRREHVFWQIRKEIGRLFKTYGHFDNVDYGEKQE